MNLKLIELFIILVVLVMIPTVSAQEISFGEKAVQKLVKIVINSPNEIHVNHVIASSDLPKQIELIDGIITNLKVLDEVGNKKQFGVIGDNDSIIIYPSKNDTIVEYDLGNVLLLKDNVWTWNFKYLETTSFIVPKEVDMIFVNNKPVYLDGKKGISCHGCQMTLEYSIDEPKILKNIKFNNKEFLIEIRTFAEINQFNFEQSTKTISFEVNGKNQFVTAKIPRELLPSQYIVFMGDEKLKFYNNTDDETYVLLNIRPNNSGIIYIKDSTTISDDRPIIQNNSSSSNINQDIIIYIIFGVILIGLVIIVIIMRKKKLSINSKINRENA